MRERRYDIDWLRVIAMLIVFVFHCSRFFDPRGWHLKNTEQSVALDVLQGSLIWIWLMELFFLLSGIGSWYALKSRTAGGYLLERVKRLLIPLYTMGLLVLLPPQVFFDAFTNDGYSGTFLEKILLYWKDLPSWYERLPTEILARYENLQDPRFLLPIPFEGHLWFIQYLFLISLIALPLLLYLESKQGQRWIERLAGWCGRWGSIYLFLIPLAIVRIGLRTFFQVEYSWANLAWYGVFFVTGYILAADNRFTENIKRHGWISLTPWLLGLVALGVFESVLGYNPSPGAETFSFQYVLWQFTYSMISWSAIVFILGLGAKHLKFNSKMLAYANEAVLPFYLLHQTIILSVGWFVVPLDMGILPKFAIISVISFSLTLSLYEALIRRFNVVRFLFGMRLKRRSPVTPS